MVKHQKSPEYYTMKYLVGENYTIVSSERLPSFDGEWREMDNNTILVLGIVTRQIVLYQESCTE